MKVYLYQGCSTCRDALKWLKARHVKFEEAAIRETPPTVPELRAALKARDGNLRSLFNTSGMDYRAMGLKEKLPGLSEEESLALLASNGNLVKRPFVIDQTNGIFLSGFKEKEWETALG
ncbi:MAG TPA: Spx/MgsR family RNA polymerase-binding regulatory protein [Verrucomicrobiales bacterium]|nr:Spx/MgsR family RNA polymerase-binding regulatory protein [Verrucomicrobiales bacterium]